MARSKKDEVLDRIASTATEDEKRALAEWSDKVLTIYKSDSTNLTKLKETATTTANFRTIKPIIALIGRELSPRELTELSDKLVNLQQSQVALPTKLRQGTSLIAAALKDLAWDNRGLPARLGISAAILTAIAFGGQGAGIAALGTAIGVPLWLVFGAGAAFAGELYERLTGKKHWVETSHTVIESKRKK